MKKLIIALFILVPLKFFGQWIPLVSGTQYKISCLHFLNDSLGFYGGGYMQGWPPDILERYVRKTTDGGMTWENLTIPGTLPVTNVTFTDEQTGYATTWDSNIKKTINGGSTWSEMMGLSFSSSMSNHQVIDSMTLIYFGNTDSGLADSLYISEDAGQSWVKRNFPHKGINGYFKAFFTDGQTGFATGDSNLYRTIDGGDSWDLSLNTNGEWISMIFFSNDSTGFIYAGNDLLRTSDYGYSWTVVYSIPGVILYQMDCFEEMIMACGQNGKIISSSDNGLIWSPELTPTTNNLFDISVNSRTAYAVGENGTLIKKILPNTHSASLEKSYQLKVYPNPANEYILISQKNTIANRAVITDMTNKTVKDLTLCGETVCSVSDLPAGLWILILYHDQDILQVERIAIIR